MKHLTEKYNSGIETSIYPNPLSEILNISLTLNEASNIGFDMYDLNGRMVFSSPPRNFESGKHLICQSLELNPGQYFLEIKADLKTIRIEKIIVTK